MTDPQVLEPENGLQAARRALHAAGVQLLDELEQLLPDHGFTGERMELWPPRNPVAPCGWVDVPTLSRGIDGNGAAFVQAVFPVLFPVDGDDQAQVQLQDMLMSRGWDLLSAVPPDGAQRVTVQTATPAEIDVGGAVLRGVVFSVQVRLLVRTLCPQRITSDDPTT